MVIVMDMATGKTESAKAAAADEFGSYLDEVMNAGWLPQLEPRMETLTTGKTAPSAHVEPEEFLRNLYRCQE